MTDEQKRKIENRVMYLSFAPLALLIVFLIGIAVAKKADTLIFPVVVSVCLAAYWFIANVLSVKWLNSFDGKTDDQKKSYYVYAGMDFAGLCGLVWFLVDMQSTTGAIIYVACLFLKKRFREEFNGTAQDDEEAEDEAACGEPAAEALETDEAEDEAACGEPAVETLKTDDAYEADCDSAEEEQTEEQGD